MRNSSFASLALFVSVVVSLALPGRAQDPCTVGDPETCDVDGNVVFCNADTTQDFDCGTLAVGAACAPAACVGAGCPADAVLCENVRGGACLGIATLFDGDDANNPQTLMAAVCAAGSVCLASVDAETCAAPPSGVPSACSTSGLTCSGTNIVGCIGFAEGNSIVTPGVLNCALFGAGFLCDENSEGVRCLNPACGDQGFGRCDGTNAISCEGGEEIGRENCATFGQACVQDSPSASPSCVTADTRCGSGGQGACSGTTATICSGGQFVTETNCADNGLSCGPVDGTGRIGCIDGNNNGGEGEGEGAADECESDSDCDADEDCNDGGCEAQDDGRGRGGEVIQPAPLCSDPGTLPVSLSLGALVLLALRRRRR